MSVPDPFEMKLEKKNGVLFSFIVKLNFSLLQKYVNRLTDYTKKIECNFCI